MKFFVKWGRVRPRDMRGDFIFGEINFSSSLSALPHRDLYDQESKIGIPA